MQTISVIFPTLARRERAASLRRALESALTQRGIRAVPLVVINGNERDPELVRELEADRRFRTIALQSVGIPAAIRAGRALVDTPYFSALDDDDLFLPGALQLRLDALTAEPELAYVVTNGYRRDEGGDILHVPDAAAVSRDPLMAVLVSNWLLPGSWLARTDTLGEAVFADMPRYLECTYLAVRLASAGRMKFLATPTVVWHTSDPRSESRTREFHLGEVAALRRILDLKLPDAFRLGIRRKVGEACHSIASRHLAENNPRGAWRWHLESLQAPGGLKYLLYSRRVLAAVARGGAW